MDLQGGVYPCWINVNAISSIVIDLIRHLSSDPKQPKVRIEQIKKKLPTTSVSRKFPSKNRQYQPNYIEYSTWYINKSHTYISDLLSDKGLASVGPAAFGKKACSRISKRISILQFLDNFFNIYYTVYSIEKNIVERNFIKWGKMIII